MRARDPLVLAAAGAAALWPFVVPTTSAHRAGVQGLALVLLGLGMTVTFGWLRVVTAVPTLGAALGAAATVRLLSAGQALPVALVAAALAGALGGAAVLLPVLRRPREGLPVSSFLGLFAVSGAVLPSLSPRPFARPVLLGVDLAGDRTVYLLGLGVVLAALAAVANLHRADAGRRLVALGTAPRLAAVDPRPHWLAAVALAGALGGVGGWLLAVLQQGQPSADVSVAAAVVLLAVPLAGGAPWPSGAVLGALVLTVVPRVVGRPAGLVAGVVLVLGATAWGDGLVGAARRLQQRTARPPRRVRAGAVPAEQRGEQAGAAR